MIVIGFYNKRERSLFALALDFCNKIVYNDHV